MLPRPSRLRVSDDFRATIRRGVRVGRATVVVHAGHSSDPGVRVGLVVSKAVGNAVTRNRVKRRLRHLALGQLDRTRSGTDVVLRALPPAASTPDRLPADLASAWSAAVRRLGERS